MLSRSRALCSALIAVVVGTAGLLSGCLPADVSMAASCSAPGVSANEINLGVLYPDSGPFAVDAGAVLGGIDARVGEVNAAGGVNGRKITYDWRDDEGSFRGNEIAARDLVEDEQVFGVIELSGVSSGSAHYLADRGVPVAGVASGELWSSKPNMFSFTYVTSVAVDTQGQYVRSRGGQRAVIVDTALSSASSEAAVKYARSLLAAGVRVVERVSFTPGIDDPVRAAVRIVNARADTIIGLVAPDTLVGILNVLRQAGHEPKVILSDSGYSHDFLRHHGARAAGITVPLVFRALELGGPAARTYLAAMQRHAPQLVHPENDTAVLAYISTDILLTGLRLAGECPTRQNVIDRLREVNSYDADRLISPISFQAGAGRATLCYSFVQINETGSGFKVVEPDLCGRELSPSP